jgi:hypothetical protein
MRLTIFVARFLAQAGKASKKRIKINQQSACNRLVDRDLLVEHT